MIPFMWSKKQNKKGKLLKTKDSIDSVALGEGVARDLSREVKLQPRKECPVLTPALVNVSLLEMGSLEI